MEDAARYLQSETPPLCSRGCGFFGSQATHNLCSKCYRDYLKEQQSNSTVFSPDPSLINPSANLLPCLSKGSATVTAAAENINTPSNKEKKNRCLCCNKKFGVLGFGFRRGGKFCGVHRYPEIHHCKFDYKCVGRTAIAEQNPLVKADKMANRI